jgi:hypothetical protein
MGEWTNEKLGADQASRWSDACLSTEGFWSPKMIFCVVLGAGARMYPRFSLQFVRQYASS